jgi:predicted glycosyltransferase
MAYAKLFVGESATMASESAILGTPAIFLSPTGRGYSDVQEHKYGLVFNFKESEQSEALKKAKELSTAPHAKEHWQKKRHRLLKETIDVTDWIVRLVEDFGQTHNVDRSAQTALGETLRVR